MRGPAVLVAVLVAGTALPAAVLPPAPAAAATTATQQTTTTATPRSLSPDDHDGSQAGWDVVTTHVESRVLLGVGGRVAAAPPAGGSQPADRVDLYPGCGGGDPASCAETFGCAPTETAYDYVRVVDDTTTFGPYTSICVADPSPAAALDIAALDAAVARHAQQVVPPVPAVTVQPPGGRALVNYPAIFAADGATGPVTVAFTALGVLPVTVTMRPVSWSWTIDGDAGALRSTHPGRRYDGTRVHLGGGRVSEHYVGHTFTRTGPHDVAVTAAWKATYTAAGLATRTAPGTATATSPATAFTVVEARSELVTTP